MSEAAPAESAPRGGFGDDRRGRRGGRRGGRGRRGGGDDKEVWVPATKLGRLVKDNKIKSLDDIFLFSISIKEPQIIDHFMGGDGGRDAKDSKLKNEVLKICPVQKQTSAGQRTRFKAWVIVGDNDGHVGLGVKCSKEVAGAITGALIAAKLNIVPVRRGYWGDNTGKPHTVPCKVSGKCGSVGFRIIPAPRGTGLVAAGCTKQVMTFAGISDAYTCAQGSTKTLGNFIHAAFYALRKTYTILTPNLWEKQKLPKHPNQVYTDFLKDSKKKKYKA